MKLNTPLQIAARKAVDWLWLYVADCEEGSQLAWEASDLANELETALTKDVTSFAAVESDKP